MARGRKFLAGRKRGNDPVGEGVRKNESGPVLNLLVKRRARRGRNIRKGFQGPKRKRKREQDESFSRIQSPYVMNDRPQVSCQGFKLVKLDRKPISQAVQKFLLGIKVRCPTQATIIDGVPAS